MGFSLLIGPCSVGCKTRPVADITTTQTAPARLVALEGGMNFRDIGGYPTLDGRIVRWGRVYRSGVLSYLTAADASHLMPLGIRTIWDLRRSGERRREPTVWPGPARVQCCEDGANAPAIRKFAAQYAATPAGMRAAMIDLYRSLPQWMGPRLLGLLTCVSRGETPVVVHCSAGKDRTGFAVAVLLSALGVPYETILEDYLMSNATVDYEQFILSRQTSDLGLTDARHPLLEMAPEVRRVLFSADADFLAAAFGQMRVQFGGLERYLEAIEAGPESLERLRNVLLV